MWKEWAYSFNHGTRQVRNIKVGVVGFAQSLKTLVVGILLRDEYFHVSPATLDSHTFANLAS